MNPAVVTVPQRAVQNRPVVRAEARGADHAAPERDSVVRRHGGGWLRAPPEQRATRESGGKQSHTAAHEEVAS